MHKKHPSESGQTIVFVVLVFAALLAFTALALDGGRLYMERGRVQNAADNAALSAAYAKLSNGDPIAAAIDLAEDNGYKNGTNVTVVVSYPPTTGSYKGDYEYIEVVITSTLQAGFAHMFFGGPMQVSAKATSRATSGGGGGLGNIDNALFSTGPCLSNNGIYVKSNAAEILGGVHSNGKIRISSSITRTVHFHGTVSSVGSITGQTRAKFDSSPITGAAVMSNTLSYLTTSMYAPGGSRVQLPTVVHDVSSKKVTISYLTGKGLYDSGTGTLTSGVYYAGTKTIELDDPSQTMKGTVTFVTENKIKIKSRADFTAYVDGILMFANKQPKKPCSGTAIKIQGGGSITPKVDHNPDAQVNTESDNIYRGLLYAPRGQVRIDSKGVKTTIRGVVIGYSIYLKGDDGLVVYDKSLFSGQDIIELVD